MLPQVKQGAEKMLREHESTGNKAVINETEQLLADSKQKIIVLQVLCSFSNSQASAYFVVTFAFSAKNLFPPV